MSFFTQNYLTIMLLINKDAASVLHNRVLKWFINSYCIDTSIQRFRYYTQPVNSVDTLFQAGILAFILSI